MNKALPIEDQGTSFGIECAVSVTKRAEVWCGHETRRIELINEARLAALRTESIVLLKEERDLGERLRDAPLPERSADGGRRRMFSWGVTVLLTLAGFAFSLIALAPFRLGAMRYLYCLGIAILAPYLTEKFLVLWVGQRLLKSIVLVTTLSAVSSVVLLAVVRGDLLAHGLEGYTATVVIDDAATPEASQPDFYASTLTLLRILMALLSFAMELAAGMALHDAIRPENVPVKHWEQLRTRLAVVRRRLLAIAEEVTALRNEPGIFEHQFWRNFHRAIMTHTFREKITKLLLIGIIAFASTHLHARADDRPMIVVALDLSGSVKSAGPDEKTDFEKNVGAVSHLLAQSPSGATIAVLGITNRSFAEPYIVLKANVADDSGYFGERLRDAQKRLVKEWQRRAATLKPEYHGTDVIGALLLASELFKTTSHSRKILVILSDMRHCTRELDLETGETVPEKTMRKSIPQASLPGVEVYALGVDGAGKSLAYWQGLERFWRRYFKSAGAAVEAYSILRELPNLQK